MEFIIISREKLNIIASSGNMFVKGWMGSLKLLQYQHVQIDLLFIVIV